MAPRRIEILLRISMIVMFLWDATLAQSQSQSESSYCTNVLISLSPCLDYITGKSSTPSSSCCTQLAFVVNSQPQCLCEVVNGCTSCLAASLNINQTLALELPSACNVQTPPISTCTGSTNSSPTGVSVSNVPNSPSGIGYNTVWSTTGGRGSVSGSYHGSSSSSSSTQLQCSLLILFLFSATTLTFTFITIT